MKCNYKGYTIRLVNDPQPCGEFMLPYFAVQDGFGDDALPMAHTKFWTPNDAKAAIDLQEAMGDYKTWPTTLLHEYNMALVLRGRYAEVYAALRMLMVRVKQCRDFDEDPTDEIHRTLMDLTRVGVVSAGAAASP